MGIGVSLLLIALGAILHWAVADTLAGVDLATIGTILMVVGIAGLLISMFLLASWRDRDREGGTVIRDRYVEPR